MESRLKVNLPVLNVLMELHWPRKIDQTVQSVQMERLRLLLVLVIQAVPHVLMVHTPIVMAATVLNAKMDVKHNQVAVIAQNVVMDLKHYLIEAIVPSVLMELLRLKVIARIATSVRMELKEIKQAPIAAYVLMGRPKLKLINRIAQNALPIVNLFQKLDVLLVLMAIRLSMNHPAPNAQMESLLLKLIAPIALSAQTERQKRNPPQVMPVVLYVRMEAPLLIRIKAIVQSVRMVNQPKQTAAIVQSVLMDPKHY